MVGAADEPSLRFPPKFRGAKALVLLLCICVPPERIHGATCLDSAGKEHWFTMMTQGGDFWLIHISSEFSTSGTVEVPGIAFSAPFIVSPGTATTVSLPSSMMYTTTDGMENKAVHVTALDDVTVYGLNQRLFVTDGFLALPVDALGTEYLVMEYTGTGFGSDLAVVATQDSTAVTITLSMDSAGRTAGVPYVVNMDEGDMYTLRNYLDLFVSDITGSIIMADKPVAVFGGSLGHDVPSGFDGTDAIIEQMPPVSTWGQNFVTIPFIDRTGGDTFRMLAAKDGTNVWVNGILSATLNRTDFYETIIDGPGHITADKPILVAQYAHGKTFDGAVNGDPFMTIVPPPEHFLDSYIITTPLSWIGPMHLGVVVPDAFVGSVLLDGVAIPAGIYTSIGSSGFSGAAVTVTLGSHVVTGPQPFGLVNYGWQNFESYGYPGGMALPPLAILAAGVTLAVSPSSGTSFVGTSQCWTATVIDGGSNPVKGIRINFNATGANTASGTDCTDVNGEAQFCYTGTSVGNDSIQADGPTILDTASRTWVLPPPTLTPTPAPTFNVWPIPFNPSTAVGSVLKAESIPHDSTFVITTVSGEIVAEIQPVNMRAEWDGKNQNGRDVTPGTYYYLIQKGKETLKAGKIVLVR